MRAIVVAAVVVVAAALLEPAASQAAAPCWQQVLDDWQDGRIDGDYGVRCYRGALSHLPEDLRVYGTAETDIQRALTRELAERATQARAVAAKPGEPKASSAPARSQTRTFAIHKPKQPKGHRTAAPTAPKPEDGAFPVKLVLVLGLAAFVAAVALASWRRAAAVRLDRRRQEP